jgi:hypothetical protein
MVPVLNSYISLVYLTKAVLGYLCSPHVRDTRPTNPMKPKKTEIKRERRERGRRVSVTPDVMGIGDKFTATKVPRQCPLVLLVKMDWRGGKAFGSEESGDEQSSKDRSWAGFHSMRL